MSTVLRKAMSLSLEQPDTVLKCNLCEGEKNIQFRCIECRIKLCVNCKIIHSNVRATKTHNILSFSDVDSCYLDTELKRRIRSRNCKIHSHMTYSLFCVTCNVLICYTCISTNHSMHVICGLDQFMDSKLKSEEKEVSPCLPRGFLARSPSKDQGTCLTAEFNTLHFFKTNMSHIYVLKTESADTAWVGCLQTKCVQRLRLPTNSKKNIFKIFQKASKKDVELSIKDQMDDFEVLDMIPTNKEDILFVSIHDQNLKLAFTDAYGQKEIHNIKNFYPFEPISIHFDSREKLYWIGLKECEKYDNNLTKTRKIIALSETNWQCEKTIEGSTCGNTLFTFPFRISTMPSQICILDRTSKTQGRVISLNSLGHLMWDYDDPQQTSTTVKPFLPTAIATTDDCKILILDAANNTLHVLNTEGEIIMFKPLLELFIERPFSLDIDPTGLLWIGTASEMDAEERRATIHVIEMSII